MNIQNFVAFFTDLIYTNILQGTNNLIIRAELWPYVNSYFNTFALPLFIKYKSTRCLLTHAMQFQGYFDSLTFVDRVVF